MKTGTFWNRAVCWFVLVDLCVLFGCSSQGINKDGWMDGWMDRWVGGWMERSGEASVFWYVGMNNRVDEHSRVMGDH